MCEHWRRLILYFLIVDHERDCDVGFVRPLESLQTFLAIASKVTDVVVFGVGGPWFSHCCLKRRIKRVVQDRLECKRSSSRGMCLYKM